MKNCCYCLFFFCWVLKSAAQEIPNPLLIQRNHPELSKAAFSSPQTFEMQIEYLGPWVVSSVLNYNGDSIRQRIKLAFESKEQARYHTSRYIKSSDSLSISIDTTQHLYVERQIWKNDKLKEIFYKCYPVFIRNDGRSPGRIGFGFMAVAFVEAMDEKGTWRLIEKPYQYRCGTGMSDIFLKQNHYACFLINEYTGDYSTLIRVRIGESVSAPIRMYINRKQFWKTYAELMEMYR